MDTRSYRRRSRRGQGGIGCRTRGSWRAKMTGWALRGNRVDGLAPAALRGGDQVMVSRVGSARPRFHLCGFASARRRATPASVAACPCSRRRERRSPHAEESVALRTPRIPAACVTFKPSSSMTSVRMKSPGWEGVIFTLIPRSAIIAVGASVCARDYASPWRCGPELSRSSRDIRYLGTCGEPAEATNPWPTVWRPKLALRWTG